MGGTGVLLGGIVLAYDSARWPGEFAADLAGRIQRGRPVAGRRPGAQGERIASRYGCAISVVGIANARGFVYDERGLDLGSVLAAAESGWPVPDQRGARCWPGAIEGLRATEADLLAR
jgi:hypothetical protein